MLRFDGRAILLDIEGTTSSVSFVYEVLFPFARKNAGAFLRENWSSPAVASARERMARDAGAASFRAWMGADDDAFSQRALDAMVAEVTRLMDADVKATGLKELQGLIWERGYAAGDLKSHLFEDVAPALRSWSAAGMDVRIYSSGSVAAQRVFFRSTIAGDLTPFLRGHYDTTTGPKRESASYRRIAADFGVGGEQMLFLSDIPAELDAAAAANLRTALVLRLGNAPAGESRAHPRISSFSEIAHGARR